MSKKHQYILLLGGNLGQIKDTFSAAIEKLSGYGEVTKKSSLYQSEPWGFENENLFLNQAVVLESSFTPSAVMTKLLLVEKELGRERKIFASGYQSRLIDIDILACDNLISEDNHITLPHPSLHLRKFALLPLQEVAPNWVHPITGLNLSDIIANCEDSSEISVL